MKRKEVRGKGLLKCIYYFQHGLFWQLPFLYQQRTLRIDNESSLLLRMHIWLLVMFWGGDTAVPSFDTTIRVNALYITLA